MSVQTQVTMLRQMVRRSEGLRTREFSEFLTLKCGQLGKKFLGKRVGELGSSLPTLVFGQFFSG